VGTAVDLGGLIPCIMGMAVTIMIKGYYKSVAALMKCEIIVIFKLNLKLVPLTKE
jgi:hypothetical protein